MEGWKVVGRKEGRKEGTKDWRKRNRELENSRGMGSCDGM